MPHQTLRSIMASEGFQFVAAPRKSKKLKRVKVGQAVALLTEQQAAILRTLPGGKGRNFDIRMRKGTIKGGSWRKRGGYMKAAETKFWAAVKKAKIRKSGDSAGNSPDGSYVGSGWNGVDKEGNTVSFSSTIGVTASDNWYSITVEFKKPAPLEGRVRGVPMDPAAMGAFAQQVAGDVARTFNPPLQEKKNGYWGGILPDENLPTWAVPFANTRPARISISSSYNDQEGLVFANFLGSEDPEDERHYNEFYNRFDVASLTAAMGSVLTRVKNAPAPDVDDDEDDW